MATVRLGFPSLRTLATGGIDLESAANLKECLRLIHFSTPSKALGLGVKIKVGVAKNIRNQKNGFCLIKIYQVHRIL